MAVLTVEEITNFYLYRKKDVPSDLTSKSLIRKPNDYMIEIV
jgi:hypothetical protein